MEVSDSSLDTDRLKGKVYGRAGIPQYWIVNLIDQCIEVHTLPSDKGELGYASREVIRAGDVDVTIDGALLSTIPVADILP